MLPEKYRNILRKQIGYLWSTWRGLGVFSEGPKINASIEEAIVGLCVFGRYDQRLFDEALSLLIFYPYLINKNKIKYMIQKADPDSAEVFAVIAWVLTSLSGDKRLQSIQLNPYPKEERTKKPFFLSVDDAPGFTGRETDPLFARYGWQRNTFHKSDTVPELSIMAALNPWIQAKLIMGNSVRVDVIMDLLAGNECASPDIARKSGYTQKSIWNVFNDFTAAGIVEPVPIQNKMFYRLSVKGRAMFAPLRPDKAGPLWQEWIRLGRYLFSLKKLPDDASSLLIESEEERLKKLFP